MKRNLVPLLAVAFVVAIVSTGIFYALFVGKLKSTPSQTVVVAANVLKPGSVVAASDLKTINWASEELPPGMFGKISDVAGQAVAMEVAAGEPVLASRLAMGGGQSGGGVPQGMRAVSVHVSDSSGVLALLKPGFRVDVQVFTRWQNGQGVEESEARTAFQNIQVLSVGTQAEPSSQGNFNAPVVTLLANPKEADALGLADSFGRIRLALRNPADSGTEARGALPLTAVFRNAEPASGALIKPMAAPRALASQVGLAVELVRVSKDGLAELKRHGIAPSGKVMGAVTGEELERTLAQLKDRNAADILSLSRVNAALSRSAAVELKGGVRVEFSPFVSDGHLKMKVQPEAGPRSVATEVDISALRTFVISGIDEQLLVVVKPSLVRPAI